MEILSAGRGDSPAGGGEGSKSSSFGGDWTVNISGSEPCQGSGTLVAQKTAPPIAQVSHNPLVRGGFIVELWPTIAAPSQAPASADDCADIGGSQPSDFWADWPGTDGVAGGGTFTPFEGLTDIRPSKEGKIIERVGPSKAEMPKDDCGTTPSLAITCTVTYTWQATITMTRVK